MKKIRLSCNIFLFIYLKYIAPLLWLGMVALTCTFIFVNGDYIGGALILTGLTLYFYFFLRKDLFIKNVYLLENNSFLIQGKEIKREEIETITSSLFYGQIIHQEKQNKKKVYFRLSLFDFFDNLSNPKSLIELTNSDIKNRKM